MFVLKYLGRSTLYYYILFIYETMEFILLENNIKRLSNIISLNEIQIQPTYLIDTIYYLIIVFVKQLRWESCKNMFCFKQS